MTEITMYAKCFFKFIHHFVQLFRSDIFWKNFQVLEFMFFGWFGCGNTKYNKKTYQ